MDCPTPFKGRIGRRTAPMRTLYRFEKPGGHWAEIRERKVSRFNGLEFIVFMDGSLLESELFHHGREAQYPAALQARIQQFFDGDWQQVRTPDDPSVESSAGGNDGREQGERTQADDGRQAACSCACPEAVARKKCSARLQSKSVAIRVWFRMYRKTTASEPVLRRWALQTHQRREAVTELITRGGPSAKIAERAKVSR